MIRIALWLAVALAGALAVEVAGAPGAEPATPVAVAGTPQTVFGSGEMPGAVAVSLRIENRGTRHDRLRGGSTLLATDVEPHRTRLVAGQRVMEAIPEGIVIPPGSTLTLEPGSSHLMLVDLQRALVQGQTFPLTLDFERAGEVMVTVRVRRKVDAAGVPAIPPVEVGGLTIALASAPPAPVATPVTK